MCGICGVIGRAALNPDREWVVRKMMDTLRHRGPDDGGLVFGQNFVFGHRRLAVIDLEYGAQPMQSEDGQVTITYNGEIYNFRELRTELEQAGEIFFSSSLQTTIRPQELLLCKKTIF